MAATTAPYTSAKGVKRRLFFMAIGALLPVIITAASSFFLYSHNEKIAAQKRLAEIAANKATEIEQVIGMYTTLLEKLVSNPAIQSQNPDQCAATVSEIGPFFSFNSTVEIGVFNQRAERLCGYRGELEPNQRAQREQRKSSDIILDEAWFQAGLSSPGMHVSDAFQDNRGRWVIILTHPIKGSDNQVKGLIAFSIGLQELQQPLLSDLPRDVLLSAVDKNRVFTLRTVDAEKWIGQVAPGEENAKLLANANSQPIEIDSVVTGKKHLMVSRSIPILNWTLFSAQRASDVGIAAQPFVITGVTAIALSILVSLWMSGWLGSQVSRAFARQTEDLAAAEARSRAIVEASPVPSAVDNNNGRILFINKSFQSTLGYSFEDAQDLEQWLPIAYPDPDYRAWVSERWDQRLHESERTGAEFAPLELSIRAKDGRELQVIATATPIQFMEQRCNLVTLIDITERKASEQVLRQSEETFRSIIQSSPVPTALADDKGRFTYINDAFTKTFGYVLDDIPTGEAWVNKAYPDIAYRAQIFPELRERTARALQSGSPTSGFEAKIVSKSGEEIAVLISAAPVHISSERYILIKLVDVSERERAAENERLYRQIWEQSSDYLTVFNKHGEVIDANLATVAALGYTREEIIGMKSRELFASQPSETDAELLRQAADQNGIAHTERLVRRKNGSVFRISSVMVPLRSSRGDVVSRLVISRDQTQEEQRQALLRKYSSLLTSAADPILTIDRSGVIQFCNPAGLAAFGYGDQELVGQSLNLLLPTETHGQHQHWIEEFFLSSVEARAMASLRTVRGRHKNGRELKLQISLSKSNDPDGVFATAVIRDITQRVHMEEQLKQSEKLAAVGQLTGGIAHDVNNDLSVILGSAELIREGAEVGSRLETLSRRIIDTVGRSASLVARMLAFSRRAEIKPIHLDLARAVREIVDTMRRTLAGRVELRYTPPTEPAWVHVDRSMLESSLINLAVNARDAMPDGGVLTFDLAMEHRDGGGTWAVLSATDTGTGMSEEVRRRVFEPFFTTKPLGGGTGLGLATVYGFVHQSGGEVDVQSTLGKGSTFIVKLPLTAPPEVSEPTQDSTPRIEPEHRRNILIVEDNELLRTTLKEQLEDLGCHVLEAGNVEQAKGLIQQTTDINFILSDLDLGSGPSGIDLAEWVRDSGKKIPGAIVSGYLSTPIERITATGWGRMQKPLQIKDLIKELNRHVPDRNA